MHRLPSLAVKRSVIIEGRKTSVSIEKPFWEGLKDIARVRSVDLQDVVAEVDRERKHSNLSSQLRLHVLDHYKMQAALASRPSVGMQAAKK